MKSARPTDSGVAMTAATSITPRVPATNGRIPNVVWAPPSGFQLVLRTLLSVTWETVKSAMPFETMKKNSNATRSTTSTAAASVVLRGRSTRSQVVRPRRIPVGARDRSLLWALQITKARTSARGPRPWGVPVVRRDVVRSLRDGSVEERGDERPLDVRAKHIVEEGLRQPVRLALRVHVADGLELVRAVCQVGDGCVHPVELERREAALVLLVVREADHARGAGGPLDGGGDGTVRVLGERLAGGLGGAPEDDLLERRARAGRCRAEDQDDLHVGPAHVLPVRGHAGPDLRGLVGCQVRHARDVWVVHHDPALDGNLVVDERRGIRGLELGLSGHVRVADLDGPLEDLGQAGARATALDLDGGARAGLYVGLAGRVDEGLERGRARRRDAAADAGDCACRSR